MSSYDPDRSPDPDEWRALGDETAFAIVQRHHRSAGRAHPPLPNPRLHAWMHVIVENQVAMGDETSAERTLRRLMAEGLDRHEAIHAIGSVLAAHLYKMFDRQGEPPSTTEYDERLRELTADQWRRSGLRDSAEAGEDPTDSSASGIPADPGEIVAGLCVPPPAFPAAAIRAAERGGGRINASLLGLIASTYRSALAGRIGAGNGHVFAMLLLAKFEDARAFDAIAEFFSLPEATVDSLVGDFLTEDLPRVLASVCEGRVDRLGTLVEDRSRAEYVRTAALSAIEALVVRGIVGTEEAADYLRVLVRGQIEQEPSAIWDEIGNLVLNLYVENLFEEIRGAIKGGLIRRYAIDAKEIDETQRRGREATLAQLDHRWHHARPVTDVVAETGWWSCFRDDADEESAADDDDGPCLDPDCEEHASPTMTVRRTAPRVGRNAPCPCGSGKKYKKCCLQ